MELIRAESDSESSMAVVWPIESSELDLLPDLESRNYSYCSSRLRDVVGSLHLTRPVGGAA
eukprot:369914-Pyramimonas_sp.AAC.1